MCNSIHKETITPIALITHEAILLLITSPGEGCEVIIRSIWVIVVVEHRSILLVITSPGEGYEVTIRSIWVTVVVDGRVSM